MSLFGLAERPWSTETAGAFPAIFIATGAFVWKRGH